MGDFYIDKQTIVDLQLLDEGSGSVFACFNQTITYGGVDALRDLFRKPLADREQLQRRTATIKFLMDNVEELTFDKTTLDFVDYYLKRPDRPTSFSVYKGIRNAVKHFFSPNQVFYAKRRGVAELFDTLAFIKLLGETYPAGTDTPLLAGLRDALERLTKHPLIARYVDAPPRRFKRYAIERIDFLLRKQYYEEALALLEQVYELDAYYAVARASKTMGLTFPEFQDSEILALEGVFHPSLPEAVRNRVVLDPSQRVSLITGANMSGKSTLMKAVGIAVYLAHLGFPVPATRMKTAVLDGLVTTINLADNIHEGYSHFYSEVKRVKLVAEQLQQSDRLLVIFDELFRGTNVKDAYDGSLRIVQAFSALNKGFFIISTHIVEIAHALQANEKIAFNCLPTRMESGKPVFDYHLREGVTDDRIGLWILEREGVFELLLPKH
ncbi:MutS-related protein [Parapedobacter sp. DT-150]|uniref:MutS-related protein n=1 Tax=Parapedobacter sp. DT-150 TaxID=3396162 RepID=UPI003F19EBA7